MKAAYADKSFDIGFNLTFLITIGYTKSILNNFTGGKITDMVNTINVNHFQLKFLNLRRPFIFDLCWEALFYWSSEINIWVWRWKATTKVFPLQGISQLLLFHSFLWHWFILECEFWLMWVLSVLKHTSLIHKKVPESLFNTALVQLLYYLLSLCSYSQLFAKVLSCTEFVFMFFF